MLMKPKLRFHLSPANDYAPAYVCYGQIYVRLIDAKTKEPYSAKCEICGLEVSELNLDLYDIKEYEKERPQAG